MTKRRGAAMVLAFAMLAGAARAASPCPGLLPPAPAPPPDLAALLERLGRAVEQHDERFLHAVSAPDIRLDLGDQMRLADLRLEDAASPAWTRLGKALSLGCRPATPDRNAWECPGLSGGAEHDPPRVLVPARGVALRAAPARDAPVVTRLSCAVLAFDEDGIAALPDGAAQEEWVPVRLRDGRSGFVAAAYAHLATGWRLLLERRGEVWRITAFLAGD